MCLTVYEATKKKGSLYRPVSVLGKPLRRITAIPGAAIQEMCQKLMQGALYDDFTEMKHQEDGCPRPLDKDEYAAVDVARMAVGFAEGQVCSS